MCSQSSVSCRWSNCNLSFTNVRSLEDHLVSAHISFTDDTSSGGRDRRCGWFACVYPPHDFLEVSVPTFVRHVKYHAFVERLIQLSTVLLPAPISCCVDTKPVSPHIPSDHQCSCSFTTDSLLELFEHFRYCFQGSVDVLNQFGAFACPTCFRTFRFCSDLMNHVVTDPAHENEIRFSTSFFCFWTSCWKQSESFTSITALQAHLLQDHLESTSICFWQGCPAPQHVSRAHLLLHAYAEHCRSNAVGIIQQSPDLVHQCLSNKGDVTPQFKCSKSRSEWFLELLQRPDYDGLRCRWEVLFPFI
uniref:C2H2-type domain-containing protein n=1 Tax=Mesocestoides corti TaxID=53468 RepID=A0A5K3EW82_MESCO